MSIVTFKELLSYLKLKNAQINTLGRTDTNIFFQIVGLLFQIDLLPGIS